MRSNSTIRVSMWIYYDRKHSCIGALSFFSIDAWEESFIDEYFTLSTVSQPFRVTIVPVVLDLVFRPRSIRRVLLYVTTPW